jgi:cyclopropane fatty-acyl-phospholipid synthase-like methyltransferase
MKRSIWNSEFARGRWDCPGRPARDFTYDYVEKYVNNGSILDLGCGAGHTASELDGTKYVHYMGVDVSDVAVETAQKTAAARGRATQNRFTQGDIATYVPAGRYDVILFMESLYYIPWRRIPAVLNTYSRYLTPCGVFVVRMWTGTDKYMPIVDLIRGNFDVLETHTSDDPKAILIVFQPRRRRGHET